MRGDINYKRDFYRVEKPYREYLIKALKHFGVMEFPAGEEFWTLGGKEWIEFDYLCDEGLKFGTGTYHNVDRGEINDNDDPRVVKHIHEFLDIDEIWQNPKVLCFDSTSGLVRSNTNLWIDFLSLAFKAADLRGDVIANWNFLTAYAGFRWKGTETDEELDALYEDWLAQILSRAEYHECDVEMYKHCVLSPKEGSPTPMLSGHCRIIKR
jgi:hypothetical protein